MEAIVQMTRIDSQRFLLRDCGKNGWQWLTADGTAVLSLGGCGSSRETAYEAQQAAREMYQKRIKFH